MKKCLPALCAILLMLADSNNSMAQLQDSLQRKWWKEAIVYQLYPRSFKDSDGDGVGDLKGIISKLDYIKSLGVDVIWLNPIYTSPNDDNGYDVSDYKGIMKEFGTMADFDEMLKAMHDRGLKLVMDLVVNHSSDEHEWFKQSRSSRTNPYRDYYHWWPAENGKPPYRYSLFDVNRDAWMYDEKTNAYYLHYFSRKQPDLNWENPKLRQEVYDVMHFWAKKGIDGFRLDAFQFAAKDTTFPGFPKGFEKNFVLYYAMQGNLHGYLQEMNKEVLSKYDVMSVAEGAGNTLEDAHNLVDEDRHELNMAYAFDAVDLPKRSGYSLFKLKDIFTRYDSAFKEKGWLSVFLANHDQARMVNRFGDASPAFREYSSKMLTTLIMTLRGTPYYYFGDELGMTNAGFESINDYKDPQTHSEYKYKQSIGANMKEVMLDLQFGNRDNGRTPFQWDASEHAGFTTGTPWIAVNKNYTSINAAAQEKDENSCLNYFRKMVQLRKNCPAFVYGSYQLLDRKNPSVYSYTRSLGNDTFLVVLNFTKNNATANTGIDVSKAAVALDNYKNLPVLKPGKTISLRPFEALVFKL